MPTSLCGLTPDEILSLIPARDAELRHAVRMAALLYKKRPDGINDFPGIPKLFREELNKTCITGIFPPSTFELSADDSVKYLFRNEAGLQYESVYIPDGKRNTVCVSTQSGCRMGCPFCATGVYGFHGNLPVRDIINQIIGIPEAGRITHVVFMGMGEPMDNLENVLKACRIITAEWGLSIGVRNVTVSTVGIEPAVQEFLEKSPYNLSLSLFSPFPEERVKVVPAEKKFPSRRIIELMKSYSGDKRRRMTIAFVMIKDINDSDRHLKEIRKLTAGSGLRVNLLPFHRIPGSIYESSPPERMQNFKHELVSAGISASIRKSRGEDVSAACGLLASGLI